jgi:selenoprotein W-related protein
VSLAAASGLDGPGLLTTFESEIGGVVLVPGSGGIFDIRIDGTPI